MLVRDRCGASPIRAAEGVRRDAVRPSEGAARAQTCPVTREVESPDSGVANGGGDEPEEARRASRNRPGTGVSEREAGIPTVRRLGGHSVCLTPSCSRDKPVVRQQVHKFCDVGHPVIRNRRLCGARVMIVSAHHHAAASWRFHPRRNANHPHATTPCEAPSCPPPLPTRANSRLHWHRGPGCY
jgi:hypothetical protein